MLLQYSCMYTHLSQSKKNILCIEDDITLCDVQYVYCVFVLLCMHLVILDLLKSFDLPSY